MAENEETTLLTQNNTDGAEGQAAYDALSTEDKADADKYQTAVNQEAYDKLSDDDKKAADDYKAAEDATKDGTTKEGAPESYDKFKMPEGETLVDEGRIEDVKTLAKELDLTQDQAQKVVDLQVKSAQEFVEAQVGAFRKVKAEWEGEVKSDEEIGGADYAAKLGGAVKVMKNFGNEKLTRLLNDTGLGSHPEVVRVFYKLSKIISEDHFVDGDKKPDSKPFYDKSDHKPG